MMVVNILSIVLLILGDRRGGDFRVSKRLTETSFLFKMILVFESIRCEVFHLVLER